MSEKIQIIQDVASRNQIVPLELLYILDQAGRHEKVFKAVMFWAEKNFIDSLRALSIRHTTRKQTMELLIHLLKDKCGVIIPDIIQTTVKTQGKIGNKIINTNTMVVHFEFNEQLLSILSDSKLMAAENLVIDPHQPFHQPPMRQDGQQFETHFAKRYQQMWTHLMKNANSEVLLPIILYIDKTHIDRAGRFTLEPVMFTLSIFNEKARRHHRCWRLLGYINKVETHQTTNQRKSGVKGQSCRNLLNG